MEKILVSILVPVYNHEAYLEECLQSIVRQKVSFSYEVLVGEDCSTDHSREVLKRLEDKLPSYFHFYYRRKNLGNGGNGNILDLQKRACGTYQILLEGDDFWNASCKLQKQVDFLETHPEYVAVAHYCTVVDAHSKPLAEQYPECPSADYTFTHYLNGLLPGQAASILYRAKEYFLIHHAFSHIASYQSYPGDRKKAFLLLMLGKVRCIPKHWSSYRHVVNSGSSFSATFRYDDNTRRNETYFFEGLYRFSRKYGSIEAQQVSGKLYFHSFFANCIGEAPLFSMKQFLKIFFKERYFMQYGCYILHCQVKYILEKP